MEKNKQPRHSQMKQPLHLGLSKHYFHSIHVSHSIDPSSEITAIEKNNTETYIKRQKGTLEGNKKPSANSMVQVIREKN